MEAQLRGKAQVYGPVVNDLKAVGKRSLEWDLNDWKWDGDCFVASSVNPASADCRSRQFLQVIPETSLSNAASNGLALCSGETGLAEENGEKELEKRRVVVIPEDEPDEEAEALNLKLGAQSYSIADEEGRSGKKAKVASNANSPVCQVEGCGADLANAKDYHRRHKVCEMHSKATQAIVGNTVQRFCQQCSRFHALQEFDEGKRSCRRRLAGHNRRRRKTHPEAAVNVGALIDEKSSSYLLITLLRVLSNLHSNDSNQTKDQDLLSLLLKTLASQAGASSGTCVAELAHGPQGLPNVGTSGSTLEKDPARSHLQSGDIPSTGAPKGLLNSSPGVMLQSPSEVQERAFPTCEVAPSGRSALEDTLKRNKLNNIDLNNVCDDSQDCLGNREVPHASVDVPFWAQKDSLKSSPPQVSGNSDSTSSRSLSSSSGSESQSRTDRIIFKLFGKDPNSLPHLLRTQLLDWLSQSPTEIEGYIKPGCIVLTIYLRMKISSWEELCHQLNSKLSRLLDMTNDSFWNTGWIYMRVDHRAAFVCNGRVVLDMPLPLISYEDCQIVSMSPIAVPASKTVRFIVRGYNISQSTSRLLCSVDGNYLVKESCSDLLEGDDASVENDDVQCVSFTCSVPEIVGRGFVEVEDDGMNGSFFPFVIADADVCSEICTLERIIEAGETCEELQEAKTCALNFLHEMGWLLRRSGLRLKSRNAEGSCDCFSFDRFQRLVDFSMDHDWPAVLKKLLDLLFSGDVSSGTFPSAENALSDLSLLHRAVRKNSKSLVASLLSYIPQDRADRLRGKQQQDKPGQAGSFPFRPDTVGPGGLTPLHIAASANGLGDVLDALLEDPGMVGIEAWKTAHDNTGLTPNDYASLRGHSSYINLVLQKTQKKPNNGQVVVDIPVCFSSSKTEKPCPQNPKSTETQSFQVEKFRAQPYKDWQCNACERKVGYRHGGTVLRYRPAMLSMVGIAAVCVCVALLFKSLPEVYLCKPFRWETLKYGAM